MGIKVLKPGQYLFLGLAIVAVVFALDQYTKWLVMETMLRIGGDTPSFMDWMVTRRPLAFFIDQREAYNTVTLTSFLNFVMVWNTGISFGLFNSDSNVMLMVLTALALLMAVLMLIWLAMTPHLPVALALSLVSGGALANAVDRIRFGAVADFVDVHAFGWHWPAFNLADSCIVIGAGLMIVDILIRPAHGGGKLQ